MTVEFDYKSLTDEELAYLFGGKEFKLQPMRHQLISLAFAADRNRVAFFHDVGVGKTYTALLTTDIWECKSILVVCPISAFGSWERDISNYTNYTYIILSGSREERLAGLDKEVDVYIINYEGLKSVHAHLNVVNRTGWSMDNNSFVHKFDCIILDEVHRCSNYKSLQSAICLELTRRSRHVVALSGTPIDKSLLDLFNVYNVIDHGQSLGNNFFAYRHRYFDPPKWGYAWVAKSESKEKILSRISNTTIRYDRQECFDLPEIQEMEHIIDPTDEFLEFQKRIIKSDSIEINGSEISLTKPGTKATLLRELSGGFLYYKSDGNKATYKLGKNPKLERLIEIIEDSQSKVIVFHQFIEGGKIIEDELERKKIKFVSVRGGQSQKERGKSLKLFTENNSITVMVAHPTCASEGFDGSVANMIVFFDQMASPKIRKQCIGRIHRKGQARKSLVIDLILGKSVDKTVAKNRTENTSLVKSVMKFIESYHS